VLKGGDLCRVLERRERSDQSRKVVPTVDHPHFRMSPFDRLRDHPFDRLRDHPFDRLRDISE
jgi:hypothetical protein